MPNDVTLRLDWKTAAAVVGALTLWRLVALGFDRTDLWVDEAQYWLWGQNLDWGYFSKPPMIAFLPHPDGPSRHTTSPGPTARSGYGPEVRFCMWPRPG